MLLPVLLAGGVDGDVAQRVAAVDLDQVDRADHPAGVADRARHRPSMPGVSSISTRIVRLYWALGVTLTESGSSVGGGHGMFAERSPRADAAVRTRTAAARRAGAAS